MVKYFKNKPKHIWFRSLLESKLTDNLNEKLGL